MGKAQAEIDKLKATVEKTKGYASSTTKTITGLADLIRQNADDPAELRNIADSLDASNAEFVSAIAAGDAVLSGSTGGGGGTPIEPPITPPSPLPSTAPGSGTDLTTPPGGTTADLAPPPVAESDALPKRRP